MDPWGGPFLNLVGSIFGPCFYLFSIQTRAKNGPYQVQKCPPPDRSIFRATSQAISPAKSNGRWRRMRVWCRLRPHVQKTIVDRFPMPFSGSVSPIGAIFPWRLFSNTRPSFGAILGKRYCWGPALRQSFCTWQMALDLGPSGSSKNIAMWHPNVPIKKIELQSARALLRIPFYLEKYKEPTNLLGKTQGTRHFTWEKTQGAHPKPHHFSWKNTRNPPGAHHFTWKNTRSPPGAHHFTWKNTRNPPGAHHFTWKNTRSPPGAHHFTWKNTRSPPGAHHFTWKTQGTHQEPTILLGKTQGAHQEPTILLGKTQGAQPFTHWEI